ncbi:MAG: glycogen/starch synthase [Crocinitomicaceae bacterium]|nr:glycogen/starch synthase [Crocinitomicaceae bacterium]
MEKKKILYISQEIAPFLPKTEISNTARKLPQVIQENGKEIRVFMPRFGVINERRHQLHEVIRLSGLNICIDDKDHPLIIKVASVSAARMQVYFIDNDDYFRRKHTLTDDKGEDFDDNDERSMFFCRGVLETVKKLGWQPDVIHCHGYMTGIMGLYIKEMYGKDPHFKETKVVYSLYNEGFNKNWDKRFSEKLKFEGFSDEVCNNFKETTFKNFTTKALNYFDGINVSSEELSSELKEAFDSSTGHKLGFVEEEHLAKELSSFYDKVIEESAMV